MASQIAAAGDVKFAGRVSDHAAADDTTLLRFLASDEMWGGPGSVADSAGVNQGREATREIEAALIALGEAQIKSGIVNPRTRAWVEIFHDWRDRGI